MEEFDQEQKEVEEVPNKNPEVVIARLISNELVIAKMTEDGLIDPYLIQCVIADELSPNQAGFKITMAPYPYLFPFEGGTPIKAIHILTYTVKVPSELQASYTQITSGLVIPTGPNLGRPMGPGGTQRQPGDLRRPMGNRGGGRGRNPHGN